MTAPFTLEDLYCSEVGWSLTTATPLQHAKCRIVEGLPLGELASHPDVLAAVGDVASLPTSPGPTEISDLAAIRCGKSEFAACIAAWCSQRVDVSRVRPGDGAPRIPIIAPREDLAHATFVHLMGPMRASPVLRKLIVGEPLSDTVYLRHPSGLPVEVCTLAASSAGTNIVARYLAGLVVEEYPRHPSEQEGGALAVEDIVSNARGRLLDGGIIYKVGTPVVAAGLAYRELVEHWGKPSRDLVVIRGRGPALNPYWWTPERCEELRRRDLRAYRRDVEADFLEAVSAAFSAERVEKSFGTIPTGARLGAELCVIDAASGGEDEFTFAFIRWAMHGERPLFLVTKVGGFDTRRHRANAVYSAIADECRRRGVRWVIGDQREAFLADAEFTRLGLRFHVVNWTNASKHLAVERLISWFRDETILLPRVEKLRSQLLSFEQKTSPSGLVTYGSRKRTHDDYVALLLTAATADAEGLLPWSPYAARQAERIRAAQNARLERLGEQFAIDNHFGAQEATLAMDRRLEREQRGDGLDWLRRRDAARAMGADVPPLSMPEWKGP